MQKSSVWNEVDMLGIARFDCTEEADSRMLAVRRGDGLIVTKVEFFLVFSLPFFFYFFYFFLCFLGSAWLLVCSIAQKWRNWNRPLLIC